MRSSDEQETRMGPGNENKAMDERAVVLRRFGDEQSTLLDQFERLSFEVQLNQAILARSLSEPSVPRSLSQPPPPPTLVTQVRQGRRRGPSRFHRVLKKLLQPISKGRGKAGGKQACVDDPKNPKYWKGGFSRSVRL